jgi:HAD superfamily hydrolase (TIGR01490 family)
MKVLALFDLDGTITKKDTLLDFIKFTHGKFFFYLGLLILSPMLVLYKLKLIPNWRSKEIMLNWYYRNWTKEKLYSAGKSYSLGRLPELILKSALEMINKHKKENDTVVIVSASCDIWMKDWCDLHNIPLIATELEFENDIFTGKFCTKNCHGQEKVKRINKFLILKEYDIIHAYGNEKSDLPMLDLAHKKYYRHFT